MLRKYTYITFILSLAVMGCNSDFEDLKPPMPEGSISFGTYVGNANSRASVADAFSLQSSSDGFGVMAYFTGSDGYTSNSKPNYMYNQQVVYGDGSWGYSPLKYWPASADEKVSFFAYAPYVSVPASIGPSESGITSLPASDVCADPTIKFEFGSDIGQHLDLLYASAKDKTNADGMVNFEFRHALSRIGFKICGWDDDGSGIEFDDNTSVTINAISMSTMRRGASLNLCSGEWSEPVNGELQAFTLTGDHLQNKVVKPNDGPKQINAENGYMMIAPDNFIDDEASKRYCVLVDYTVETVDPNLLSGKLVVRNKVYRYLSPNFEAGKAYTINIHLGMTDSSGSEDDGNDIGGPAPIDPNPDDPTIPSTGGKNSYVKFSASVVDWGDSEDIHDNYQEEPIFNLAFSSFSLNGQFYYESGKSTGVFSIKSFVSEGSDVNILREQVSFSTSNFSVNHKYLNFAHIDLDKTYLLTIEDENGDEWTASCSPNLSMMQFTLDIPESGTNFVLPLATGTLPASVLVVWDEEKQSSALYNLSASNNNYTYSTAGLKRVKIFSSRSNTYLKQITEFNWTNNASGSRALLSSMDTPILNSEQTNFNYAFKECVNLISISPGLFDLNKKVTSYSETFYNCGNLQAIPDGLFDNGSLVTNMKHTFYYCSSVTAIPEGLFDNCPLITSMWGVFLGCTGISSIPVDIFKNNALVTDFTNIFANTGIYALPAGIFENCSKAENMYGAFYKCQNLETIEEGALNGLGAATSYAMLFSECINLTTVPQRLFSNSPNAKSFASIFYKCSALETVPSNIFENCISAENFYSTFQACTSLREIPESLFSDCSVATTFGNLFKDCSSITTIPAGLFANNSLAYSMGYVFSNCTSLTEVPPSLFDSCFPASKATASSCIGIFKGCNAITSSVPELWNWTTIRNYGSAFNGCVNAANYADIPSGWK